MEEEEPSSGDITFGRFVSNKVPRSSKNLGIDKDIFAAYGPPLEDNQIMPWDHPVPFIGVVWPPKKREGSKKDDVARFTLDNIYNLLRLHDVKPHLGAPNDHYKGLTCFWCQQTFFENDITVHFQEIFHDFQAGRPVELEPHISRDEIDRCRINFETASSEDRRFECIAHFIVSTILKRYESG